MYVRMYAPFIHPKPEIDYFRFILNKQRGPVTVYDAVLNYQIITIE